MYFLILCICSPLLIACDCSMWVSMFLSICISAHFSWLLVLYSLWAYIFLHSVSAYLFWLLVAVQYVSWHVFSYTLYLLSELLVTIQLVSQYIFSLHFVFVYLFWLLWMCRMWVSIVFFTICICLSLLVDCAACKPVFFIHNLYLFISFGYL